MSVPRIYGIVRNGDGQAEWDFPAPGKARWLNAWNDQPAEQKDEDITLADEGVCHDMIFDEHGNIGIGVGVRHQGQVILAALDPGELLEVVTWLGDTLARHDAIGRSMGARPSGAIEAIERIARKLGDSAAETAIEARRSIIYRKMAREVSRLTIAEMRRYYTETRTAAMIEIRAKVKALCKAAMEPDRREREEMVEQLAEFIKECLTLDRSEFDRLLRRIDTVARRAGNAV